MNEKGAAVVVNKKYFTDLMKDRGLSMREVARRMDAYPAGLSRALDGKRRMPLQEAAGLARVLSVPLAEVMLNAGIEEAKQVGRRTNIIGHALGVVVELVPDDVIERIPIPDHLPDDVVALQYHTAGTVDAYRDGWVVFLSGEKSDPSECIGKFCLINVENDGLLLGTIQRGYATGTFNVQSIDREIRKNVSVTCARRALITQH